MPYFKVPLLLNCAQSLSLFKQYGLGAALL